MKRIIVFLSLLVVVLLTLCACSQNGDTKKTDNSTNTQTETNTNTSTEPPKEYVTVTVNYKAEAGGTIVGEATQSVTVEKGQGATFVSVLAKADEGYRFVSWNDGSTEITRVDTFFQDTEIIAIFERIPTATITYLVGEGGMLGGTAEQTVEIGKETTSVKAIPFTNYRFIGWDDGVTTEIRTDIVTEDKTVVALFEKTIVTVEYKCENGGTIEGQLSQTINTGSATSEVTAIPDEGYKFVCWNDGYTNPTRRDIANDDAIYLAVFKKYYVVEFKCDEKYGTLIGVTRQEVLDGEYSKSIYVNVNEGYEFISWSNGNTSETLKVQPKKDMVLEAYFTLPSSGLPVISIDTENGAGITSKDVYVNCTITIHDTDNGYNVINQTGKIQGRGNSTWTNFDKKPYKFKFDEGQNLFGFGKDKDWVLLADYIDKALIRNFFAYTVASQFSELVASPNCQSVELYLNGEYRGVYLLAEQIEVDDDRVEIDTSDTTDTGFLVEMDGWQDNVQVVVGDQLNGSRKYSIKYPENDDITTEEKAYIEQYLKECIAAINGSNYDLVEELIDTKSFAQAYIVYEMFKNPDVDYSSFYLYKAPNGKLVCGPVWDFDMSIGNVNHKGGGSLGNIKTLWAKEKCPWFNALLKHEEFEALVGIELEAYVSVISSTLSYLYDYVYEHEMGYLKNFEKWDVIGKNTWTNPSYIVELESWQENIEYTRNYLNDSLAYLMEVYPSPSQ